MGGARGWAHHWCAFGLVSKVARSECRGADGSGDVAVWVALGRAGRGCIREFFVGSSNVNNPDLLEVLPDPPDFSAEVWDHCRQINDFREVLFEYYKNTAVFTGVCSSLMYESEVWAGGSRRLWVVLTGLLKRCERLMAAHLEFFQDDRYGDSTYILDRSLLETCINIRWLSDDPTEERLKRYFEDSLSSDRDLHAEITKNIEKRGGTVLKIEARMLRSLRRNLELAGYSEADYPSLRRGVNLASKMDAIGERRFIYTVIGKLGSHAVHGTWANLLQVYLDEDDEGKLSPAKSFPGSHVNQYIVGTIFTLDACMEYVQNCFEDSLETTYLIEAMRSHQKEISELNLEVVGDDYSSSE